MYAPSIVVGESLAMYFIYENKFAKSVIKYFNLHMHMYKKFEFLTKIFKNCFGFYSSLVIFIIVLKRPPKQTRFSISAKIARDDLLTINTFLIYFLARCQLSDL